MRDLLVVVLVIGLVVAGVVFWAPWANADPTREPTDQPRPAGAATAELQTAGGTGARADAGEARATPERVAVVEAGGAPATDGSPAPAPVRELTILVRDASGDAVGSVPVALACARPDRWTTLWHDSTAEDGTAVVADALGKLAAADGAHTIALVDAPLRDRPRADVDPRDPSRDPIVLTLPPTGRVEVALEHDDPARLEGATVRIRTADVPATDAPRERGVERHAVDGRAAFAHVGLGLRLEVRAELAGGNVRSSVEVDGPRVDGETVVVRLPVRATKPVLVARLLGEDGAPLTERRLRVRLRAERGGSLSSSSFDSETDARGRVFLELADELGADTDRVLRLSLAEDELAATQVTLPLVLRPGDNDLGDLVLTAPPLVCAGRVENRRSEPVAGARVSVERKRIYDRARSNGWHWASSNIAPVETDDDGRFVVRGLVEGSELAVSIESDGYLALDGQPIIAGTRALLFTLDQAGALSGRLLVGDLPIRRRIEVRATRRGQDDHASAEPDRDGSFHLESLVPGRYDAEIRLFGQVAPVVTVFDIAVRGGETTEDPRLADVDLGEQLRRVRFRVVDQQGRPVRDGAAMMLPEGDEQDSFGAVFLERGQGDVLATRAPLDLFVFADSHRSARVRDVRDGQEIVLSGGLELRIRLPRDTPAPTAPFWLSVVLFPDDPSFDPQSYFELRGENRTSSMNGSVPWADMLVAKLGSDGTALLRLPEPGRYTVHWDLHRTQGGLEREERVEFQETVEVRDQAGEQAWTSGITPRMLTKAREKF